MNTLAYVLILIAVLGFIKYLNRKSNELTPTSTDSKTLQPDKSFAQIGLFGILLGALFPVLYIIDIYNRNTSYLIGVIGAFILFGFLGTYLILYYKNTRVTFDDTEVRTTNFLKKTKAIKWTDVTSVKYLSIQRWFRLKNTTTRVYVPMMVNGFSSFKKELLSKVSSEKFMKK